MSGAIIPLPQYAFMAWCSVKEQGQLYLYLTFERFEVFTAKIQVEVVCVVMPCGVLW
jgi:hypothetical protein